MRPIQIICLSLLLLIACLIAHPHASTLDDTQAKGISTAAASALNLTPDYLPLNLGNRWVYLREDSRFKPAAKIKIEIISQPILNWKTYFVFTQLPFVPGLERAGNILVRYDIPTRRFLRLTKEGEVPLFPVGDAADARFETAVDDQNHPVPDRLSYLTCLNCRDAGLEVLFDRGVGISAAQNVSAAGTLKFTLKSALVNGQAIGEPMEEEPQPGQAGTKGPVISHADPLLSLTVTKSLSGATLHFRVKNPARNLLSLFFDTSQTYDFLVLDKESGSDVWRWSKDNFFSKVTRNVAMRPDEEWDFEAVWDFKNNQHYLVRPGNYLVVAVLATREPKMSAPIEIAVP